MSFWSTADDLHGRVSIALMKQMAATPREGWIRASAGAGPGLLAELARLSSENGELRSLIDAVAAKRVEDQKAEHDRILRTLHAAPLDLVIWYENAREWKKEDGDRHLYDFFYLLAPELMLEKSVKESARFVAQMLRQQKSLALRADWPLPSNRVKTWFGDLAALGLVEPSSKKHSVADKEQYWSLTQLGKQIYTDLRRMRLEQGLATGAEATDE